MRRHFSSLFLLALTISVAPALMGLFWIPESTTSISSLKLLDVYVISNSLTIQDSQVGGLSGIDYDPATETYYLICDDRSSLQPARFYTAKIAIKGTTIDTIQFAKHDLVGKDGNLYPGIKVDRNKTIDPEGIRYNPKLHELVWVSEGERILRKTDTLLVDPGIFITNNGKYVRELPIPPIMQMQATESGARQNGTFEGLTFTDNYSSLLVSLEEPLFQDGPRADVEESRSLIRICKYDMTTGKNTMQYAYDLEPVAYKPILPSAFRVNGVTDILDAGDNKILVMERSFSTGRLPCTVKIFLVDLASGADVAGIASMKDNTTVKPLSKNLILNMDDLDRHIDNVEGVTWGPSLPNGHRTLVFVSDNNFQSFQQTQFLLFEVIP